jgi:hypothetical protein
MTGQREDAGIRKPSGARRPGARIRLAPEDEVSVLAVPVRIKVPWSELSALIR